MANTLELTVDNRAVRRIFIVEDHALTREGLRLVIERERDLAICGESWRIADALEQIEANSPDLTLIDLQLGGEDGLDLVHQLKARRPTLPSLVVSMYGESMYAEFALRAGARGYVMKSESTETLLGAIRCVLDGGVFVSPEMSSKLLLQLVDAGAEKSSGLSRLSHREYEVFRLVGQGEGPTAIAARLGVSIKTIETYREQIKSKLGLDGGRELLRCAMRHIEQRERPEMPAR